VLKKGGDMKSLKSIQLLLVAFTMTGMPTFASTVLSVEEAAKKGLIKLSIKGKGGFTGEVIEMKIQNLSHERIALKVEAGRRLDSKDNAEQDILVTQPQEFFVNASQNKIIAVYGMCCQAHNAAPDSKSIYLVGKLADSNLVKLAHFIDENKYYTSYTAQQSVWVVSDDNSLGSISDGSKEDVDKLQKFVSTITGKIIPPYSISYQRESNGRAMGTASKIEGEFDYSLPMPCHATMGIYTESGKLIQLIFENLQSDRGDYKLYYTFKTLGLPEGTYYARVNADGMLQKQIKIEF
jgi:hypothetical protein